MGHAAVVIATKRAGVAAWLNARCGKSMFWRYGPYVRSCESTGARMIANSSLSHAIDVIEISARMIEVVAIDKRATS